MNIKLGFLTLAALLGCVHLQGQFKQGCTGSTVDDNFSKSDAARARGFVTSLQDAVRADDRSRVASMIRYPLRTPSLRGGQVANRQTLLARYDEVFTNEVKAGLLSPTATQCLLGNYQGFMVGSGAIWFDGLTTNSLKVITVNVPVERRK